MVTFGHAVHLLYSLLGISQVSLPARIMHHTGFQHAFTRWNHCKRRACADPFQAMRASACFSDYHTLRLHCAQSPARLEVLRLAQIMHNVGGPHLLI
ncbi:hypothetical protein FBU59_006131 [Linderina macrospora]|uniref:Uncharacterized protein n=1 Tax=Linderina macrospora TaxID=4868 RepID=A0ACC1J0Q8_9FUNG|nr:hypothetical protein FBU59_006131 [Linderina macrospora]